MYREFMMIAFPAVAVFIGVYRWQKGDHLLSVGKKTTAIIFKNNYDSSGDINIGGAYAPVVRFLTDKQVWITQEVSSRSNIAKKEGTEVEVIYDPNDPTNVEINSTFRLKFLPRFFVGIGLFGLAFGFLELFEITNFLD